MKKIINAAQTVADEMCRGFVIAHPAAELLPEYRVIRRRNPNPDKVSLISGGGSGHEPAHAGFVGPGMLDAAVCGDVFSSPSQLQVYQAIRAVAGRKGTLLIIKNYSGDIMNFGNAALLARTDGLEVDSIKVDDDIAVQDSLYTVGRRGVAGTVLVHKIAGAAAEAGKSLAEVKRIAQKAADSVRSLGFAYTSCTVPAKGTPTFTLAEDEMEYGVGIHGEPGVKREKILSADDLAKRMADALVADLGLAAGDEAFLLVNGFGATPLMELYLLNLAVVRELAAKGIRLHRALVGNYMTSIDMAGASVSLLRLDAELKTCLEAPCDTPGFRLQGAPGVVYAEPPAQAAEAGEASFAADPGTGGNALSGDKLSLGNLVFLVDKMAEVVIRNEVAFCDLDSHAGDGDFGMSLAKGFRQLKRRWKAVLAGAPRDIGAFLDACAMVLMEHCGGASGPVWGFAFKYAAAKAAGKAELGVGDMADVLGAAVAGIQAVGENAFGRGAVVGDKTIVDALSPCADAWRDCAGKGEGMRAALDKGARAAVDGARKTEDIVARMGRAGNLGKRSLGHPDAGAHALGVIFTELAAAMK